MNSLRIDPRPDGGFTVLILDDPRESFAQPGNTFTFAGLADLTTWLEARFTA